jgi:hypothetical protein
LDLEEGSSASKLVLDAIIISHEKAFSLSTLLGFRKFMNVSGETINERVGIARGRSEWKTEFKDVEVEWILLL